VLLFCARAGLYSRISTSQTSLSIYSSLAIYCSYTHFCLRTLFNQSATCASISSAIIAHWRQLPGPSIRVVSRSGTFPLNRLSRAWCDSNRCNRVFQTQFWGRLGRPAGRPRFLASDFNRLPQHPFRDRQPKVLCLLVVEMQITVGRENRDGPGRGTF
jgi:hypothetical protein